MFKLVLTLCLLHVLIHFTYSYTYVELADPIAEPGTCLSNWYNLGSMNYGESKNVPNKCELANCIENGNIYYYGCSIASIPNNCKFDEPNRVAPYPKCCKAKAAFTCD